ncbi:hypothetical protein WN51_14313 [Melipona quadrifasciata]|uniref:Uncharacterized protein n=1 Tax=Melipona quadrifasciata TaxID=166423 RepID=A0A0M9A2L2_9HYME|nr:hypothetical protein WN51_14313 [Melipona quadrifasciata]
MCNPLLKREQNDPFSKHTITDDEIWIVYSNIVEQGKVMLSIWWKWKSIVFFQGIKRLIRILLTTGRIEQCHS